MIKQKTFLPHISPMAQVRLLSSRSFWREHILEAIDECIMWNTDKKTLTIGKKYKPIFKELTEKEFAIKDDYREHHWYGWDDFQTYFKIRKVAKKNGR